MGKRARQAEMISQSDYVRAINFTCIANELLGIISKLTVNLNE